MLAAETAFEALTKTHLDSPLPLTLETYDSAIKSSWIQQELHEVRNVRPSFTTPLGIYGGMLYSGLDTFILKGRVPFTIPHGKPDHATLKSAKDCEEIVYPKPDGVISFSLLENLSRSGTGHREDQPGHLVLKRGDSPQLENSYKKYAGPEGRFCP
jgi:electron-transferring-flavoprotein dehydrogenase